MPGSFFRDEISASITTRTSSILTNDSPLRDRKNDETMVIVLRAGHMFHVDRYNHIRYRGCQFSPPLAARRFVSGLALREAYSPARDHRGADVCTGLACAELNGHEVKE
jgi:hypothetical protein